MSLASPAVWLSAAIGFTTLYIAWQQAVTAKRKLMLDLFDRRLRVYEGMQHFMSHLLTSNATDLTAFQAYSTTIPLADFLFGADIRNYLEEIQQKALRLRTTANLMVLPTAPRAELVEESSQILTWLTEQIGASRRHFRPYLSFEGVRGGVG